MRRWIWRYKLLATLFVVACVCLLVNLLLFASMSPSPSISHRLAHYDIATQQPFILARMLQQQEDSELKFPFTSPRSAFRQGDKNKHEEDAHMVAEVETGNLQLPEQVIQAPVVDGNADVDADDHRGDSLHLWLKKLSDNKWRQQDLDSEKLHANGANADDNEQGILSHITVELNDTDQEDDAQNDAKRGKLHLDIGKQNNSTEYGTERRPEADDNAERHKSTELVIELAQTREQPLPLSHDIDFDEGRDRKDGENDVIRHTIAASTAESGSLGYNLGIAELTRLVGLLQKNIEALSKQQQHPDDFRYHPRNIYHGRRNPDADDGAHHKHDDPEKLHGDQQIGLKREDNGHDERYRQWFQEHDAAADDYHAVELASPRLDSRNSHILFSNAGSEARNDNDGNLQEQQRRDWREIRYRDDIHQPDIQWKSRNSSQFENIPNQHETGETQHSISLRKNNLPYIYASFMTINKSKEFSDTDYLHNSSANVTELIKDYEARQGPFDPDDPGEEGRPVDDEHEDASSVEAGWQTAMFNQVVSDKISLERSVPDTRHPGCRMKTYNYSRLPRTSVVICFTDESWSTLLRTVHSIINRTPPQLLEEILLVDDFSQMPHLHEQLDDYIDANFPSDKVRLVRLPSRQGLIGARLHGVQLARAPVVTFLDSHVECNRGWLEPLLATVADNPSTVAAPVIDIIQADTFAYVPIRDDIRGGFDWKLTFQWLDLPDHILVKRRLGDATEPIYTPTLAGGMFAIDVTFFKRLGMYDPQLEIWGSENLELSFKTWMCGGRLVIVPCSRVGHVFRATPPYSFSGPGGMFATVLRNSARVAEVWMDEYKLLFYRHFPWFHYELGPSVGDVTERQQLRKTLRCHSFTWYLDNVFPELYRPSLYPVAHGQLRNLATGDCMTVTDSGQLVCATCTDTDGAQYVQLTNEGRLEMLDKCVGTTGENVDAVDCGWDALTVSVRHRGSGDVLQVIAASYSDALSHCITASNNDEDEVVLLVLPCQPQQRPDQHWTFTYYSQP